jgi:serine O-acetyltransferase
VDTISPPTRLRKILAADLLANTGHAGFCAAVRATVFDRAFSTVLFYRLAAYIYRRGFRRLGLLVWRFNIMLSGCHIHLDAVIGPGLCLPHPTGVAIGMGARLERSVTVYQNVTVGRVPGDMRYPVIGEGTVIFPNAVIVGGITVGARAVIGAGTIVLSSVPADAIAAGNPASVIRRRHPGSANEKHSVVGSDTHAPGGH